ncbi:histidinol-phosphatase HisJ family protein [Ohessyouella blattaphilus]|uniref:Histidinol-phosphatase n=1 Tax=Ohessyouella blattaphilus TaxID=2949333 RepID=A0ABT1EKJ6_9FIRM|nr:histidinol-phosphatase HisJ family protein [Ohessyouella blattaphilus]MCP1111215.1 histidinol-phosphatase HisJ family protein [Ohessyouella blattaphilus]MCR8564609.1 histidinol-phosphatase HisJ family protein [Ohessyouella blattaphilus]
MEDNKILTDCHLHTRYSHDSKAEPEAMIRAGIAAGLTCIGITDHYDFPSVDYPVDGTFDVDAYFEELLPLKEKYQEQIKVLIGIEMGLEPERGAFFQDLRKKYPFDYAIGSTHIVKGRDPAVADIHQGRPDKEVYLEYFEEVLANVRACTAFDVLGHLDYAVRYGQGRDSTYHFEDYRDVFAEIFTEIIRRGKAIEINTAGLKYKLPFPHPQSSALKLYRNLGGKNVTIASDGHQPEQLAYAFDKVPNYLAECGFSYYSEPQAGGFVQKYLI